MEQGLSVDVLNEVEAAAYLKISPHTLRQGRCSGHMPNRMTAPPFYRLGRRVVYLKADLLDWLRGNAAGSTRLGSAARGEVSRG